MYIYIYICVYICINSIMCDLEIHAQVQFLSTSDMFHDLFCNTMGQGFGPRTTDELWSFWVPNFKVHGGAMLRYPTKTIDF